MKVMPKGANTCSVGGFYSMCWSPESQFPGTQAYGHNYGLPSDHSI